MSRLLLQSGMKGVQTRNRDHVNLPVQQTIEIRHGRLRATN